MNIDTLRHSAAHILAHAVKNLFPRVKLGIGPTIEDGFYYDFDKKAPFTPDDLEKIEKEMRRLITENHKFQKLKPNKKETRDFLKHEPFKKELYQDLKKAKVHPTFFKNGKFLDLCAGPHISSSNQITAFKLLKVAGAYWKGDSSNKQLQRIYGIAFSTKKELVSYLKFLEQAEKRNHIKLGKQLDLFSIHPEGHGFIFWHNNGVIIKNELIKYWRQEHQKEGYTEIQTPTILNKSLWETSGHWKLYKEFMYTTKIENKDFSIKPMNCPGGMLIYKEKLHSYKELPLRVGELGLVHRHELSGVLNGLFRVRAFTQDDAHIFCTPEQLQSEIISYVKLTKRMLKTCGFKNYRFAISVRGKNKKKYLGTDKGWKLAEQSIANALKKLKINYEILEGEAKFYGPSLDILIQDSLKREWQCGTIQIDFNLPQRFNITYEDKNSKKQKPFVLHRVVYGSLERFIGILLEHYAGALPLWLSPIQVLIITVSDKHKVFANKIKTQLEKQNIRVKLDDRAESVSKKIRESQLKKIPATITIGDKEVKAKTLAIRTLDGKVKKGMKTDKFIKNITKLIETKA